MENWRSTLSESELHEAEQEIAKRIVHILRCYDSLGRLDDGKYGLVLPGCNSFNAVGMAERLRQDIFSPAVSIGCKAFDFKATFAVVGSGGRSPLVVLRNAEDALSKASMRGTGSIVRSSYEAETDSAALSPPVIWDETLHW